MINTTKAARDELKRIAAEEGKPLRVRVAMRGGGCSGFTVDMFFTGHPADEEFDRVTHQDGIDFVIDEKSAMLLNGAKLDYGGGLLDKGFKWEFPNATGGCGCGLSFSF